MTVHQYYGAQHVLEGVGKKPDLAKTTETIRSVLRNVLADGKPVSGKTHRFGLVSSLRNQSL